MNKITLGFFRTKSTATIKTVFVLFAVLLMNTQTSWGQISITGTGIGNTYTQDFNTLANTGTTNAITTLPSGWTFVETGTNANTTYAADTGSGTAGNTYSYGVAAAADRAFGGLQSGTLIPVIGVSFTNNTGVTITELVIAYTGEQWRLAVVSRVDRLDFQYSVDATSLATGAWTNVDNLDFTAPVTLVTGAKDGNVAANRTSISNTITGLSIAPGATFWLRFNDFNASGSDDGLAVDDFSMYAKDAPGVSLSATILTGFSATPTTPSSVQTINMTAANLTADVTVTPSTNFEISTSPSSGFGGSLNIPQLGGIVASTPIYVRIKSGVAEGPLSESITFASAGAATQSLTCIGAVFTNYYYKGTGSLATLANWGTNPDGTGTAPADFGATANQAFVIRNIAAIATDATWAITGNNKVVIGAATYSAVTLTISLGFPITFVTGALDIAAASSGNNEVIFQNATLPTIGAVDVSANITYAITVSATASTNNPFNTLKVNNSAAVVLTNSHNCKFLVVDAGSSITANTSVITLASGGNATINGTYSANRAAGLFTTGIFGDTTLRGQIHNDDATATITLGANSKIIFTRTNAQTITPLVYANLEFTGAVVLNTDITVNKDLTLFLPATTVTLSAGKNLTVGNAIVNNGTLTIANNANLIQTAVANTNSGSGTTIVNRTSNPLLRLDYTMWSSPVAGTQKLSEFSPATIATRFYTYDNTLPPTGLYTAVASPSTTPFTTGTGYLIRMPDTDLATDYNAGTGTLAYPEQFTGTLNNGDVTLTVASGTFNAVGNPYPSTIVADEFIADNAIIEALYFWRKTNNVDQATAPTTSYATYTLAGGTGTGPGSSSITPNGFIQVGQGFIAKSTSTTLKFTNSMRTANNANQILKTKVVERNRIWLNLSSPAGGVNQMMLAYMTGATQGIDAAIDGRYFNDSATALNSLVNNEEFAIQGRSLPFDATDTVPLAFKTTTEGNFTISIDHVDGLFSGTQDIYLVDSKTGTETNLKTNSYTFTADAAVDNARFSLKFQKTLSLDAQELNDNSVIVYKNGGVIYVNSGAKTINNIKVFDILGRVVAERNNVKANTSSFQNLRASNQVLIVKVTTDDNQVISKKVEN